eukprot:TRINITY_DN5446_c0_g1_i1.p1 TRINITY_DN5446_c0_g1~~TRINITY_DN5446_c0_g1_i1.p1  ORF type:complete len:244 (+),score=34.04 TRINITY_DN5446_c0_g1_i1:66-797(+)
MCIRDRPYRARLSEDSYFVYHSPKSDRKLKSISFNVTAIQGSCSAFIARNVKPPTPTENEVRIAARGEIVSISSDLKTADRVYSLHDPFYVTVQAKDQQCLFFITAKAVHGKRDVDDIGQCKGSAQQLVTVLKDMTAKSSSPDVIHQGIERTKHLAKQFADCVKKCDESPKQRACLNNANAYPLETLNSSSSTSPSEVKRALSALTKYINEIIKVCYKQTRSSETNHAMLLTCQLQNAKLYAP